VLSLDSVTLIRKHALESRICRLSSERMREVCKALAIATGCDSR
jgi:mRNA-degrading endonuclease toxin of MazEF toxin-antitoxin module